MKKKLLLVLLPALALGITGCKSADKGSEGITGSEQSSESSSGGEHGADITPEECGTAEAPLTIAQAKALFDKADPTKSGAAFTTYPVFVEGACYDNAKKNSGSAGDHNYAKIADSSNNFISIQYYVTDSSLGTAYDNAGSMVSKKVVASGYAQIYKKGNNYIYQLVKKDDSTKPTVLSVSDLAMPSGVNYGTAVAPLSVAEAATEIDKFPAKVTDAAMYVTGTVKSNDAADPSYGNLSMVIEDADHHEFTLYRVSAIPGFTTDQIKAIKANDLVGATVVSSSVCKFYFDSAIYETNANPTIEDFDLDVGQITSLAFNKSSYTVKQGASIDFGAELTKSPALGTGTVEYSIDEGVVINVTLNGSTGELVVGDEAATQTIHVTAKLAEDASVSCSAAVEIVAKSDEGEVEDVLTAAITEVPAPAAGDNPSYTEWSGKSIESDAVYAGQSATSSSNEIQLRSKNSNSGVYTTTSGGRISKVTIAFGASTENNRKINVYGSNSAYSSASDLYDASKAGTALGTIIKGTNTELEITGDYAFVALRSDYGAIYITSITFTWEA